MLRKSAAMLLVAALPLAAPFAALAAAPAEGLVVEGESVPGIALGSTRAEVEAAYGEPNWCQSVELSGDLAYCSFPVDGGGGVAVRYRGPDGRNANNSPDDVVYYIRWSQYVSGWTTTAGVNTELALADRPAVADAYPNAEVTYDSLGNITRVEDPQVGILISWSFDSYTHTTHVYMAIFYPQTPVPPGDNVISVTDIDYAVSKTKGVRRIVVTVQVQDDRGLAAAGADVFITWTYPWGATQSIRDTTSETGYAFFEMNQARHGTYTFTVDDVVLEGYQFDRDGSVLSVSIKVK